MVFEYVMWRKVLLMMAVMLAGLNKRVSAQGEDDTSATANGNVIPSQTLRLVAACVKNCDELPRDTLTGYYGRQALDRFKNNTRSVADGFCRGMTLAATCYQNCSSIYRIAVDPKSNVQYRTATVASRISCFTDDGNCRSYDSKLWCEEYSPNLCGSSLKTYIDCYTNIQRSRGCDVTEGAFKSQRIVQTAAIEAGLYCLGLYEQEDDQTTNDINTCKSYITNTCLSGITYANSASDYTSGNLSCSDQQVASACILSTLNSTIPDSDVLCSRIPDKASTILYLAQIVERLPGCFPPAADNESSSATPQPFSSVFNSRSTPASTHSSGAAMKCQLFFSAALIATGVFLAISSS